MQNAFAEQQSLLDGKPLLCIAIDALCAIASGGQSTVFDIKNPKHVQVCALPRSSGLPMSRALPQGAFPPSEQCPS